ncbi:MAG: hypothetical protein ACOX3E_11870 [Desulfomonilia bacterium]|jgi:hypothetical protein|uniref:Uncharacterized protein n=1 Tax=anaerobic digester metagenome TaxID=1263854 RepID=A0A485LYY8_9ZZZZ|nr:hypothetical protein [Pseudomonadota bacterium]HON38730.1 hypothetical protein [Deltaproteobacteria bacterium]HRS56599.1 hypothetical protein [Desulfomonilia bacterium]HPD21892.1 hypothetical protein [Deltaproteobacteria bacterium]HPX18475.1 hypothetical protein [Deltaproteobacteria bacterium]
MTAEIKELRIVNADNKYGKVNLVEPATLGYIRIAATVQPGVIPVVLPSIERTSLLVRLKELARDLERVDQVVRVRTFRAVIIPPTPKVNSYLKERGYSMHAEGFDVVALIETASPETIPGVQASPAYSAFMDALQANAKAVNVLAARNVKRIADVDMAENGLFLFNSFVADDANIALELWDYLADWFMKETGLDNSIVLAPLEGEQSEYAFINLARWNASLPHQLFQMLTKKSFRGFVIANLEVNRVGSLPAFYRLA